MPATPLLVLSSGGLHSLVAAGVASRDSRIAMLHINDGRSTSAQAAAAFEKQVAHFRPIKNWTIATPFWRQMSLPPESTSVIHATNSDSLSPLIPLRELQMLSIAAGFARQIRASAIVWGIQIEPKQTDQLARGIELIQVLNQAIDLLSIDAPVTIRTPLMGLEDSQVIELGYQMSLPYTASWSCQMAVEASCMSCPACARRVRAFRAAQLVDPLTAKKAVIKA